MRLQFGEFLLDTTERALSRDGVAVALEPKVFDCLALLASQPGKLTTTETLRAALWPEIHVASGALRRTINQARKALGDEGRAAIRSRRALGYVFTLEVRDVSPRSRAEPEPDWPFLGRERELAVLRDWLARSSGGLCFVSAEAGMGKSSLVARLARETAPTQGRWLLGCCQPTLGTPAFWPFRELVAQLSGDPALRQPARAWAAQKPELLQLVPELAAARSVRTAPSDPQTRFELCEALARIFRALSRSQPLYLVIEDVHWADDGSIMLLGALARAARDAKLYVLATYRPDAVSEDAALAQLIARTSGRGASFSLHLPALDSNALCVLLEALQLRISPAALLRLTGGNALYVRELVRHVRATGASLEDTQPPSLQHILAERLARLPSAVQELLAQAAALGDDFSLVTLAAVVGQSREALERWLKPALRSGALQRSAAQPDALRFSHALVRESLLRQLPDAQKRACHHAALRALSALPEGAVASAELAVHAFEAGDRVPALERRRWCEQAGHEAFAALGFERAALHFARALQLSAADSPAREDAAIALSRARALWHADRAQHEVEAAFQEAAARARRADAPALLAEAAIGYALGDQSNTLMRIASLRPEARELAEQAWARLLSEPGVELSSWPDALAYRLAATLCWLRVEAGELAGITHAAQRACALAPPRLEPVQALWLLALRSAAEPERAGELIDELQACVQSASLDARHRVELCAAIMHARLALGQLPGWERAAGELARAAELLPEPPPSGRAGERASIYLTLPLSAEITRAVMQGRLADAELRFRDVLELARRLELTRSREGDHDGFHMLLQLFGYLGRSRELEPHVDRELEREPRTRWFGALLKAQFALERGERSAAASYFAQLRATGFRPTFDGRLLLAKPETLLRAADVSVEVGSASDAALLYDALRSRAERCIQDGALICWGACARPLAALAFQQGQLERAERHFRDALVMNERVGHRPELVRTRIGLARLQLSTGSAVEARALLVRAEQDAAEMGMSAQLALARSLLASPRVEVLAVRV